MAGETTLTKRIFAVLAMAARYRLFLRLFFLALLGLSIFLIVRTNFTNDLAEMLPDNSRSALAFQRIANSPMFNKVIVVFHLKQGVFSGSGLPQEIEKTAERLKDNPYITRADYRFFPESLSGELAGITAFLPQISAPPDSLFTSQNAQDTVRKISRRLYLPSAAGQTGFLRADPFGLNLPLYRKLDEFRSVSGASFLPNFPYLVSQDEKHAMMLLETTVPVSDAAGSRKLLDSLDKVLQKLPPEMEAEIISGHLHAVSNETILKKDIGTVGIMSVILFSLLFVLFYRCDFRSLAIPVLPVLASLIVLGAMTLIFRECLFFIVGMGGVVISLAVDYGIHTYAAVRSSRSPCRKLARLAPAIFAGAVTSALAFGLFLFSRISACRQLGFFAGTSLLLSFFLMLLLLPSLLGRRRKIPEIMKPFRFPVRHPVICTVVWILVFISSFFILGKLGFQMDIRRFDATPPEITQMEKQYDSLFQSGPRPAMLLLSAPSRELALEKTLEASEILRSEKILIFSPADLLPPLSEREKNLALWRSALNSGTLGQLEAGMREAGAEYGMKNDFFAPFFNNLRLGINTPANLPNLFRPIVERLISQDKDGLHTCAILFPDTPQDVAAVSGLFPDAPVISQDSLPELMSREVSTGILSLALMTIFMVVAVAFLFFRSAAKTVLALLPVCAALLLTGAFFALTGIPVSLSTLIAGIILAGLSIDYGIFMVHSECGRRDGNVFHALTLSAATSAAGGVTVVFTTHPMLRDAGFTLIAGIAAAWAASVILLPALYHLKHVGKFLPLLFLLLFSGCRTEPFQYPEFQPVPPVSEAKDRMNRLRGEMPQSYLVEAGVVAEYYFKAFSMLTLAKVDLKKNEISVAGLTPAGAKLFELQGKNGIAESFWWLPNQPWSAYEKEASQQMMRDLFHIYTDLLPPERCSVMGKNGKWEIHVDDFRKESTRTEYLFAGNPPLPVRKKCHKLALTWFGKRFCAGTLLWQISYYRYILQNGKWYPADIVLENERYSYRLIIRTRKIMETQ